MTREIKFRVWDVQKGEMHYDGCVQFEQFAPHFLAPQQTKPLFFPFDGIESGVMCTKDPLNSYIVMEFTGIKSENGIPVYEGDILKSLDEHLTVVWNSSMACWDVQFVGGDSEPMITSEGDFNYEVVGNIYENANLLTE